MKYLLIILLIISINTSCGNKTKVSKEQLFGTYIYNLDNSDTLILTEKGKFIHSYLQENKRKIERDTWRFIVTADIVAIELFNFEKYRGSPSHDLYPQINDNGIIIIIHHVGEYYIKIR